MAISVSIKPEKPNNLGILVRFL